MQEKKKEEGKTRKGNGDEKEASHHPTWSREKNHPRVSFCGVRMRADGRPKGVNNNGVVLGVFLGYLKEGIGIELH